MLLAASFESGAEQITKGSSMGSPSEIYCDDMFSDWKSFEFIESPFTAIGMRGRSAISDGYKQDRFVLSGKVFCI